MVAAWIKYPYMGREMIEWNIEEMTGYKPITTYYTDFGIAEWYGEPAIKDTYRRAMQYWGQDIRWATEIAMVLNWKCHEHHVRQDKELEELYVDLWEKTDEYIRSHYDGDDLAYYYRTTD